MTQNKVSKFITHILASKISNIIPKLLCSRSKLDGVDLRFRFSKLAFRQIIFSQFSSVYYSAVQTLSRVHFSRSLVQFLVVQKKSLISIKTYLVCTGELETLHQIAREVKKSEWNCLDDPCTKRKEGTCWNSKDEKNYTNIVNCTCYDGVLHISDM